MMDYREINWGQDRPDQAAVDNGWSETALVPVTPLDPRLSAVVQSLEASHGNGGARLGQFLVKADPATRWFVERNRFEECDFFQRLFAHATVRETLPDVATKRIEYFGFAMEATFTALGRLAGLVRGGGAYDGFEGTDEQALVLATEFMRAMCDMRLSETWCWISWEPWSPWFQNVAWDASFFWWDTRTGIATVLLVTDTD